MEEKTFRVISNSYNTRGVRGGSIVVEGTYGRRYSVWHEAKDLMGLEPGPDNYFIIKHPYENDDQILDEELRRKIIMAAWPMVDEV